MKKTFFLFLALSTVSDSLFAQNTKHFYVNAGYLVGTSRAMNSFIDFRKKDNFVNKNGFFVGASWFFRKYTLKAIFTHQKLASDDVLIGSQSESITRFNYMQVSTQRVKRLGKKVDFLYGISTNINVKSDVKFIRYLPNGEVGIVEKIDAILLYVDPINFIVDRIPFPTPKALSLNLTLGVNYNVNKHFKVMSEYHLPITSNAKNTLYIKGFYQSSLNIGLGYKLK